MAKLESTSGAPAGEPQAAAAGATRTAAIPSCSHNDTRVTNATKGGGWQFFDIFGKCNVDRPYTVGDDGTLACSDAPSYCIVSNELFEQFSLSMEFRYPSANKVSRNGGGIVIATAGPHPKASDWTKQIPIGIEVKLAPESAATSFCHRIHTGRPCRWGRSERVRGEPDSRKRISRRRMESPGSRMRRPEQRADQGERRTCQCHEGGGQRGENLPLADNSEMQFRNVVVEKDGKSQTLPFAVRRTQPEIPSDISTDEPQGAAAGTARTAAIRVAPTDPSTTEPRGESVANGSSSANTAGETGPKIDYQEWEWHAGSKPPFHLWLYSNGLVGRSLGVPTNPQFHWTKMGNTIVVRWPQGWVDTVTRSRTDDRSMVGKNAGGVRISAEARDKRVALSQGNSHCVRPGPVTVRRKPIWETENVDVYQLRRRRITAMGSIPLSTVARGVADCRALVEYKCGASRRIEEAERRHARAKIQGPKGTTPESA